MSVAEATFLLFVFNLYFGAVLNTTKHCSWRLAVLLFPTPVIKYRTWTFQTAQQRSMLPESNMPERLTVVKEQSVGHPQTKRATTLVGHLKLPS